MSAEGAAHPEALSEAGDGILASRAADGDTSAFDVLARRHTPLMRAYVYRIVGSLSETDDALQEALLVAWRQMPTLRDTSAVRAWMMRIASRAASAQVRARVPHLDLEGIEPAADGTGRPETAAVRAAEMEALARALAALPDAQRQCWLLREVEGLSYADIAEQLGLPISTIRGDLARARASITIQMEGWR